jgi:hypothetical protein
MQIEALIVLRFEAPAAIASETFILYMPAALAGACAGLAIFRRLTTTQFNRAVNALLVASGFSLFALAV